MGDITDHIEERRRRGLCTTLHKIRAHTNIRGNDLVDAAAELAITHFESLPEHKILKIVIAETVPPLGCCTPRNNRRYLLRIWALASNGPHFADPGGIY